MHSGKRCSGRPVGAARLARLAPVLLLATVFGAASGGCTTARQATRAEIAFDTEPFAASGRFRKEYVLVPGDSIEVSVWRTPEMSRTVVVRPDGYISLPTLSDVSAAGLTFSELEARLTERLSARLVDPEVTVIATNVRQNTVYVLGDVPRPSVVPLHQATTALQAIAAAGGFLRSGARSEVSIIRLGSDGVLRAIPVPSENEAQPDPMMALSTVVLQPDDIVFVPESKRAEVVRFLDDFVGKPLSYVTALTNLVLSYKIIQNND